MRAWPGQHHQPVVSTRDKVSPEIFTQFKVKEISAKFSFSAGQSDDGGDGCEGDEGDGESDGGGGGGLVVSVYRLSG